MVLSLYHYFTINHSLIVDLFAFLFLFYDKIRGVYLGLCRQSVMIL